jgi:nucleoside-diphosphate-sugar epimerase
MVRPTNTTDVIVAGGTGAVGRAVTRRLTDVRLSCRGRDGVAAALAAWTGATARRLAVTDPDSVRGFVDPAAADPGGVDVRGHGHVDSHPPTDARPPAAVAPTVERLPGSGDARRQVVAVDGGTWLP